MPDTAGTLVDTVLQRVRDPQGSAHTRAFVRDVLTKTQQLVNVATKSVTTSVTLTTDPWLGWYPVFASFPTAGRIIAVRDAGRDLVEVPWRSLAQTSHTWLRDVGPRHEAFAVIGRDLLVVYPTVDRAVTLTLVAASAPAALDSDDDVPALPPDVIPLWLDVAVAVLLARSRQFDGLAVVIQRIAAGMQTVLA